MYVTRSQRDHPLNRKADELLRQMNVNPSDDILSIVLLTIMALDNEIQDIWKAALFQLNSEAVMQRITGKDPEEIGFELKPEELDDATPYQAAFMILEALGFEDAVYVE